MARRRGFGGGGISCGALGLEALLGSDAEGVRYGLARGDGHAAGGARVGPGGQHRAAVRAVADVNPAHDLREVELRVACGTNLRAIVDVSSAVRADHVPLYPP